MTKEETQVEIAPESLAILQASLEGDLHTNDMMRTLYATDASVYREMPLAVAIPKTKEDIRQLIAFANQQGTSLIPRTAGTSLAGQCVGSGIVVDVSVHFNQILEVDEGDNWVRVEPGVIRDDLNRYLSPHKLFFGPNTSTANRAMIGGMVGNNSCGSYSIVYGTTRDHVLEVTAFLSDGSEVVFRDLTEAEFAEKCKLDSLEGNIYRHIREELANPVIRDQIISEFPRPEIHRRNTGYAVDTLLSNSIFSDSSTPFNFCKLISGSEGTLAFITEVKIHVDPTPPSTLGLLCIHFESVPDSLKAVVGAMKHQPRAVELMDKIVMDCTIGNLMYEKNRFFIEGDPAAVLVIETGGDSLESVNQQLDIIEQEIRSMEVGYHFPRIYGDKINQVWDLRKAGLGLLANIPGDAKAVAVIEDTAVRVEDLPDYISEFETLMKGYGQRAVYYAHAGAGELHLRPILDLKKSADVKDFWGIAHDTAKLVKKYQGSLSGEHGDGRLRAEFIPMMVGEANYELFKRIKQVWDPGHILNPGKIVEAAPMNEFLRYEADQKTPEYDTIFDFSGTNGILRAAEKCNGSGDCRKSHQAGGTMCPSYMATRNEKDTTRARANVLREFLTQSSRSNPFSHEEIYEVMDLCLSCKGCTSECPSNVDMATLKAEFLHQYYQTHGTPIRARMFAAIGKINRLASEISGISNFFMGNALTGGLLKQILGVAHQRSLPALSKSSLRRWFMSQFPSGIAPAVSGRPRIGKVYFFCDEFSNYNDAPIGATAIQLLNHLGYEVEMPKHAESGRSWLSKGLLKEARKLAMYNVEAFGELVSEATPLIGIEPSAILSFRDEYPRLVIPEYREAAQALGPHALMIDEFIAREIKAGRIRSDQFTDTPQKVLLHGHCHQKSLASVQDSVTLLSLPAQYEVETIPSGCCGMAGSFGYEKEHYEVSMQVGELVLFPSVRAAKDGTLIAAPGTSCRHQIADGTQREALHPVEILWQALKR